MAPLISIIIPTYNSAAFILKTLESVSAQTWTNWEAIIIDDGSTDDTVQTIKDYAARYPEKFAVHVQENQGPATARNKGIELAKGDFVAFLDSDDIWHPEKLAKQMEVFNQDKEIGLVCTGRFRVNEITGERLKDVLPVEFSDKPMADLWTYKNWVITSSVLVRRSLLNPECLFNTSKDVAGVEDLDVWLRIAEQSRFFYLKEALVDYQVRKSGYNRSNINQTYQNLGRVLKTYEEKVVQLSSVSEKRIARRWAAYYLEWGKSLFCENEFSDALEKFKLARVKQPYHLEVFKYMLLSTWLKPLVIKKRNIKSEVSY